MKNLYILRNKTRGIGESLKCSQKKIMISVFNYTDYRKYLADFYNFENSKNRRFSYRYIAEHVGFNSAGFFTKILKNETNISMKMAEDFSAFLKLTRRQEKYFLQLVQYNQAKEESEKKEHFEKMLKFKEVTFNKIDLNNYKFFDKWYYPVIRDILAFYPYNGSNPADLANMLIPTISVPNVKNAIKTLEELNLIKKDKKGFYKQVEKILDCGDDEVNNIARCNYMQSALEITKNSVFGIPREERLLSATTISISDKSYDKIVELAGEFRKKVLEIAEEDGDPSRTNLMMVQLFPVSQRYKD